jgi:hypothetical protein
MNGTEYAVLGGVITIAFTLANIIKTLVDNRLARSREDSRDNGIQVNGPRTVLNEHRLYALIDSVRDLSEALRVTTRLQEQTLSEVRGVHDQISQADKR